MNFSDRIKEELLGFDYDKENVIRAFILGAVKAVGLLEIKKTGESLLLSSGRYEYVIKVADYLKKLYRTEINVSRKGQANDKKGFTYELSLPKNVTKQLLIDLEIANYNGDDLVSFNSGFSEKLYKDEEVLKALVRALFIGCGNAYVPSKIDVDGDELTAKSEGYRLELVFEEEELASNVCELLKILSNKIKVIERQINYVVYTKDSSLVCDILAWLGANNSVLELNDIIVERTVSNEINRKNNCSIANIDKVVNAGLKQIKAIEYLQQTIGLDKLNDGLREIALLRISKPSASLVELEEALDHRITKSGINHRLRKLVEMADKLRGEGEN